MKNPRLDPEVTAEAESQRGDQRQKQPYATEVDSRELEHAHREKRPVDPNGGSPKAGLPADAPAPGGKAGAKP